MTRFGLVHEHYAGYLVPGLCELVERTRSGPVYSGVTPTLGNTPNGFAHQRSVVRTTY